MAVGAFLVSVGAAAERGRDGHVAIIYWQAPSILNPYLSGGTKDLEAASMILEPLARFDESGNLTPWLAASVPTVANGGVSADLEDHHLEAARGPPLVGRKPGDGRRCRVYRRILPRPRRRLFAACASLTT